MRIIYVLVGVTVISWY